MAAVNGNGNGNGNGTIWKVLTTFFGTSLVAVLVAYGNALQPSRYDQDSQFLKSTMATNTAQIHELSSTVHRLELVELQQEDRLQLLTVKVNRAAALP